MSGSRSKVFEPLVVVLESSSLAEHLIRWTSLTAFFTLLPRIVSCLEIVVSHPTIGESATFDICVAVTRCAVHSQWFENAFLREVLQRFPRKCWYDVC